MEPEDLEFAPRAGAEPAESGRSGAALRASEAKDRLPPEPIQEGLRAMDRDGGS